MQDPALLEATGSEPLSLSHEYNMQEEWIRDSEMCTFIVLSRDKLSEDEHLEELLQEAESVGGSLRSSLISDSLYAMAGDVNVFLSDEEASSEDEADATLRTTTATSFKQAELDIMVAEKSLQRQGIGREASCLMMLYTARELSIRRFFCKINENNESSLSLFRKLGFEQCAYAACFRQVELELKRDSPEELIKELTRLMGDRKAFFQCTLTHRESDPLRQN